MSLPTVAVGAVVVEDDRLLVVRRGRAPAAGLWSVPGGRVEPEETIRDAVEREVLEETGLVVEAGALAWWGRVPGDSDSFLVLDFHASLLGGRLEAGSDAAEARWVRLDAVRSLAIVPTMHDLLEVIA